MVTDKEKCQAALRECRETLRQIYQLPIPKTHRSLIKLCAYWEQKERELEMLLERFK